VIIDNVSLERISVTDDAGRASDYRPDPYSLSELYPNPANPVAHVRLSLPEESRIQLVLVDLLGRRVLTIANGTQPSGLFQRSIDLTEMNSGIYFCRLQAQSLISGRSIDLVRKLVVIK
jgi:hypothetical protein